MKNTGRNNWDTSSCSPADGDYRSAGKVGIQTLIIGIATVITLGEGAAALAGGKGASGAAAIAKVEKEGLKSSSSPSIGQLRAAGQKDAHHIIQDAAVKQLPGYNTNAAPGVKLVGPPNTPGTPHYNATQSQRLAGGGGTYAAERRIGYKALRRAGVEAEEARGHIQRADTYFESIGVTPQTQTRIPGNRR